MILLSLVQTWHILNDIFMSIYPYIFSKKYDIYFTLYLTLIVTHWFILNECILSYLEKKLKDKNYVMGSKPREHPYRKLIPSYARYSTIILKTIAISIVFYRSFDNIYVAIPIFIFFLLFIFKKIPI